MVNGYVVRPGALLLIAVYQSKKAKTWTWDVATNDGALILTTKGGYATPLDAFNAGNREYERIQSLRYSAG